MFDINLIMRAQHFVAFGICAFGELGELGGAGIEQTDSLIRKTWVKISILYLISKPFSHEWPIYRQDFVITLNFLLQVQC